MLGGFSLSFSGPWSSYMCKIHFTFQELRAVVKMLHRMAFCLSGEVVALHLDNNVAKVYILRVVQCLFFFSCYVRQWSIYFLFTLLSLGGL